MMLAYILLHSNMGI